MRRRAQWITALLMVLLIGPGCGTVGAAGLYEEAAEQALDPFNDMMLQINASYVDRYLVNPAAASYSTVLDAGGRLIVHNVLENSSMPRRLVNNLLQSEFRAAGVEFTRFLINTTLGGGGMADVAKYQFGLEAADTNMGRTLEAWGWTDSAYLVIPFMRPLTFRDGLGLVIDQALNPASYFALPIGTSMAMDTIAYIDDRAGTTDRAIARLRTDGVTLRAKLETKVE